MDPQKPPSTQSFDLTGKTLAGRYSVDGKLGQGGMASIYYGHDSVLERDIAIKIVPRTNLNNVELLRFQREARTASTMTHPNLIQLLDFGVHDTGQPFMIMELIQGVSIEDLIKRHGAQSFETTLEILEQIANGMSAVHKAGIIHRDLKASNVMLVDVGMNKPLVRILDFGIAKSLSSNEQVSTLTQAGQIFGSPNYMSPEQARGEELDPRSDIYSLGCIAFEMLTGKPLFEGDTIMQVVTQHISEPPPLVSEAVAEETVIPAELDRLIARLVEKQRSERPESMNEVATLVKEVRNQISASPEEESYEKPQPKKTLSKKTKLVISLVSVLALILSAVAFYLVNQYSNAKIKTSALAKAKARAAVEERSALADLVEVGVQDSLLEKQGGLIYIQGEDPGKALKAAVKSGKTADNLVIQDGVMNDEYARMIVAIKAGTVNLGGCSGITDNTLKILSQNPKMRSIDTDLVKGLTPMGFSYLTKCPVLTVVSFRDCDITDEHLKALASAKHVYTYELALNPRLTEKGLKYLSRKPAFVTVIADVGPLSFLPATKQREIYNTMKITLVTKSINSTEDAKGLSRFLGEGENLVPMFSPGTTGRFAEQNAKEPTK